MHTQDRLNKSCSALAEVQLKYRNEEQVRFVVEIAEAAIS